jgi:hypothetical protein
MSSRASLRVRDGAGLEGHEHPCVELGGFAGRFDDDRPGYQLRHSTSLLRVVTECLALAKVDHDWFTFGSENSALGS